MWFIPLKVTVMQWSCRTWMFLWKLSMTSWWHVWMFLERQLCIADLQSERMLTTLICWSWRDIKVSFSVRCMTFLFLTFHNKSNNMKALVILSHSWSPFRPLTCWYGNNELLWVSVWLSGVFSREKIPPRLLMQTTWTWTLVGRFSHALITVRQKKMWT